MKGISLVLVLVLGGVTGTSALVVLAASVVADRDTGGKRQPAEPKEPDPGSKGKGDRGGTNDDRGSTNDQDKDRDKDRAKGR